MATTTNYGWDTPDDTDLVKDGAAAIRTLGSSVDTTTKNLNPQTSTGAIAYRSATANVNTALAIGTAGQVLTVNSGATAPEWAAPVPGALTKIASASYSAVASVTVDSVFSSTYKAYLVIIENSSGTDGAELALQFRYGSSTEGGANYNNGGFRVKSNQTTVNYGVGSATAFKLIDQSLNPCALNLYFTSVGNTSEAGRFWGTAIVENTQSIAMMGGRVNVNETYTGFVLSVSTGTTTGRYAVYGLAN